MHSWRPGDSRSGGEEGAVGGWYLRQCRQEQGPAQTALGVGEWPTIFPHGHGRLCPAASSSWGVLEGGTARADGDSRSARVCPGVTRWAAGCRGGALADPPGAGKTTSASSRQGAEAGSRADHPAHLRPPKQPTAAPHHLRRHLFHRFLRLPHRRVSFALESFSCFSLLPLPTLLQSLVARLLAHFLTYYGRGIQPSSENTTKPALFMTIQRGRRQYGAASQPALRPPRLRPWRPGPALSLPAPPPPRPLRLGVREAPGAPPTQRGRLGLQTREGWSVRFVLSAGLSV